MHGGCFTQYGCNMQGVRYARWMWYAGCKERMVDVPCKKLRIAVQHKPIISP
jgi:hypothetical protein